MNAKNAALIRKVQAQLRALQPELADALLRSLDEIIELIPADELRAMLAGKLPVGSVLEAGLLARGFGAYRAAIRAAVELSVRLTIPDLPKLATRTPSVAVLFNFLDPVVIDAVRSIENKALATLTDNVKETVRAYVENGIRDGKGVPEMARGLRSVIGIAPHQERYVDNLVKELRELSPKFKARVLRDRRFDSTITRAITTGTPIPEAKIQQIAAAYRKRFGAFNTQVVTRQATIDAFRTGNKLSWDGAVENGYVDGDTLWRRWLHSDVSEVPRPEHLALDGTEVRYNEPFANGDDIPGLGDFGCNCSAEYFVRTPKGRIATSPANRPALF